METTVGARIRELREARHLTREMLADQIGISTKFLYEIERGGRNFSSDTLCRLSKTLSVSCDYIMFGEEDRHRGCAKLFSTLESLTPEELERIQLLLEDMATFCAVEREADC